MTLLILTLPIMTHETQLVLPHGTSEEPPSKVIQLDIDAEGRAYWNGVAAQDL